MIEFKWLMSSIKRLIVQENLDSIFESNNSWSDFTLFTTNSRLLKG